MVRLVFNKSENSIDISFPYDPDDSTVLDLVKLLPDRKFTNQDGRKFWRVPIQPGVDLEHLVREFCEDIAAYCDRKKWDIQIDPIIYTTIQAFEAWKLDNYLLSTQTDFEDCQPLNTMFKSSLSGSQKSAAWYMFRNARGVINGNDDNSRRLETLAALELSSDQPCLITCPQDQKFIWASRVKLLTGRNSLVLGEEQQILSEIRDTRQAAQVVICNFGNLHKNAWLFTMPWRAMVIDGAHNIKNASSEQAKLLFDLAREIPHRYLLSDSDYMASPVSILVQLELIERLGPIFGGRTKFLTRYESMRQTPTGWHLGASANQEELDTLLRENCYVRAR